MTNDIETSPLEDTARLRAQQVTAHDHLRQLIQRVNDLVELLRAQRDILRQRGMNLPPGALDSLKGLRTQLEKLRDGMAGSLTELKQLRALAGTTSLINSSLAPAEVLNQVMDTVIRITGAERGYIALYDSDTGTMEYPVQRGIDKEQIGKGELVVSTTIVTEVAEKGEPVLTENASKDTRYQGHQSIIGFQLRSILAVPLKVRGQVIGVVYCDNSIMAGLFKPHDLNLLQAFANQAAVAIENARLFEALRRQVAQMSETRDLLTSIFASIANGVITLTRDGQIDSCNRAAEVIIHKSGESIIGHTLDEVLPSLDGPFHTAVQQVREAGTRELVKVELDISGLGRRYWNVVISPLRDANQMTQGVAIVLDDITEIRQREEQFGQLSAYIKVGTEQLRQLDMGGQEREISALHCDVRGFTTFSEQLDPEKLMEIINSYMSLSSDAVDLYGGVVDKYMGDAVTGLFNTQFNPQEDHAVRAVRAAMSMMYDLYALHEVLPEQQRLFYGIGVHTGMAVLGNIGGKDRREFGGLGDAFDLAKLLQENAQGGEVLISEATYERVQEFYECEAIPPRKNKGRPDFTTMYKVLRHKRRNTPVDLDKLEF
ncbi:MAG: GAF domain-containing protein [Anaerolineae bacterium]|nr:GAF domain-containing protein [Anaerolineae bacterium]